ncbi:MAG: proline--tRNA ligase [Elusimicrobia bacterium]|nr:proline--tRNA ligase [Elusimicrobiota bacterium]
MRLSQAFPPTSKKAPADADTLSAQLMFRAGLVRKLASGIYEWLPLGLRSLKKAEQIVREEMDALGGQEVWLPVVQPKALWEKTGRWQLYGQELLRFKDRKGSEFCLAPTAEEVITDLAARELRSYRQLPTMLYQFSTKFRDELRPRFGVLRAREFYMKDAYSFDATEKDAEAAYEKMRRAYEKIFTRCGLRFKTVEAQTGPIGGSFSHEFMVTAETGESEIASCSRCGFSANTDLCRARSGDPCPKCKSSLEFSRGIEVGHTFKLGDKYSRTLEAQFLDLQGKSRPLIMGCYGIGVSRVVAAAIEQSHDENGISWPLSLAPYTVILTALNLEDPPVRQQAESLYRALREARQEVLFDDRPERAGVKFHDADLLGIPLRLTLSSKTLEGGCVELKPRNSTQSRSVSLSQALPELQQCLRSLTGG